MWMAPPVMTAYEPASRPQARSRLYNGAAYIQWTTQDGSPAPDPNADTNRVLTEGFGPTTLCPDGRRQVIDMTQN